MGIVKTREQEWPDPEVGLDCSIDLAISVLLNYYAACGYDRHRMQDYLTACLRNPPDSLRTDNNAPQ